MMHPTMDPGAAVRYLADHQGLPPDGLGVALALDFGQAEPPPEEPPMDTAAIRAEAEAIIAHADERDPDSDILLREYPPYELTRAEAISFCRQLQDKWGLARQHAQNVLDLTAPKAPAPPVEPPAPMPDENWAILLDGAPGLVGREKWLVGSTGSDLFVRRGTLVRAPAACRVQYQGVPVPGVGTIGEMVLTYPDGRAVRFRHVSNPKVSNGNAVLRGQPLCVVYDASMDRLRWPAGYPTPPDGYQHLDLALATSAARLNPQGGAGGDVDTFNHVWAARGGLPGFVVIERTPGPQQGAMTTELQAAWAAWAGQ